MTWGEQKIGGDKKRGGWSTYRLEGFSEGDEVSGVLWDGGLRLHRGREGRRKGQMEKRMKRDGEGVQS